jgi:hypothetical protein
LNNYTLYNYWYTYYLLTGNPSGGLAYNYAMKAADQNGGCTRSQAGRYVEAQKLNMNVSYIVSVYLRIQ